MKISDLIKDNSLDISNIFVMNTRHTVAVEFKAVDDIQIRKLINILPTNDSIIFSIQQKRKVILVQFIRHYSPLAYGVSVIDTFDKSVLDVDPEQTIKSVLDLAKNRNTEANIGINCITGDVRFSVNSTIEEFISGDLPRIKSAIQFNASGIDGFVVNFEVTDGIEISRAICIRQNPLDGIFNLIRLDKTIHIRFEISNDGEVSIIEMDENGYTDNKDISKLRIKDMF